MFHGEVVSIIIVKIRNGIGGDHALLVEIMHYGWRSCNFGCTNPRLGAIGDPQCAVSALLHCDMITAPKVRTPRKSAR